MAKELEQQMPMESSGPYGYSTGLYQHRQNDAFSADFGFTSQVSNHLLELGGGLSYTIVRGYGIFPQQLISQADSLTEAQEYANAGSVCLWL
ncbi:MAG: hypothetical protein MZV64_38655 [Ignavibacteriales bacterium]|nr:hypothetical protein [Ignavibacteriales bacterium]